MRNSYSQHIYRSIGSRVSCVKPVMLHVATFCVNQRRMLHLRLSGRAPATRSSQAARRVTGQLKHSSRSADKL